MHAEERNGTPRFPARHAPATLGVEEEFLLVDPADGGAVDRAPRVLETTRARSLAPERYQAELLSSQVEATTGVCTALGEVADDLLAARRALARAAAEVGAAVLPVATTPLSAARVPITEQERFARVHATHREAVADYHASGCHIHVGVPDEETAVQVVNHLRPWLPTLLALSVNSPYSRGLDTGFCSWRALELARLPGSGVPPRFDSAAEYRREVERLTGYGCLVDARMTFWLARPSPRWPTVEIRAADTAATVAEAALQAALSRALVATALDAVRAGEPPLDLREQTAAAAVWSAARYGLDGPAVDPWAERLVPAMEMTGRLLDRTAGALEATGERGWVGRQVDRLALGGTGAERQRRVVDEGRGSLVAHLSEEFTLAPDLPRRAPRGPADPGGPRAPGGPAPTGHTH